MSINDDLQSDSRSDSAEKRLWFGVLLQAFQDAMWPRCNAYERGKVMAEARKWLTRPSDSFNLVCGICDQDPERVRTLALQKIAEADANPSQKVRGRDRALTHNGETKTRRQWSQETGLSKTTINHRIREGWSISKTLSTPSRQSTANAKGQTL